MGSIVGRDVRVPHAVAVDTQSVRSGLAAVRHATRGQKTVSRLDLSRTVRAMRHRVFPWP